MPKKNVLITGAAGFIGSHVAKHLKERGDHVVGFDNFNSYYAVHLKQTRAKILEEAGITVIKGDICHLEELQSAIRKHKITHLVHLAAQPGVRYSIENPHAYVKTNLEGFVNILEACRHKPKMKLTYASSSSVYGPSTQVPFKVDERTDNQASLYGATKKSNELLATAYHNLYGISVTALRFFTVYGPWGRPDMAYYTFTKAIYDGHPIKIFNNGHLERDFTYIDDIVAGTTAAIDLGADHEIFNLGHHEPVNVRDFVSILEDAIGKKAQKIYLPMQQGDVTTTFADISHSQNKLNFSPKTSLIEGIPRFIDWYKCWTKIT